MVGQNSLQDVGCLTKKAPVKDRIWVVRIRSLTGAFLDRILLEEDGDAYVERAKQLAWPPAPTDTKPFWQLERAMDTVDIPVVVPIF